MRWSQLFVPTLREAPADAEAMSHKLLLRAGFMRQLHSGHYSMLPLGWRTHQKIANIIRAHMDAVGCQELHLPAMHPARLWQKTGRWDLIGDEMFRLKDRKDADLALGVTHEEIFATIATEISSYKDLPQQWYQIQNKFRDEPRPKSGLLRVREFYMKDAYSFDLDEAGLDASFEMYHHAYVRIFNALSLPAIPVEASSGAMGGSGSTEFMVPSPAGEDDVVICRECGYAANVERATAKVPVIENTLEDDEAALETFDTPGVRTIAQLAEFDDHASAKNQIKTLVMVGDDQLFLVCVRGDHMLNEQKLQDFTGFVNIYPATAEQTQELLGASPGSLGAVGVEGVTVLADQALAGRTNMVTGANKDDLHYRGVNIERDIAVTEWADLREVVANEPCINCDRPLEIVRCIESGHIFKLGRKYTEAMGVTVLDQNGKTAVPIMGSYGIGVGRAMAAIVETHHDDAGMIWPVAVAPFEATVISVANNNDECNQTAEDIYKQLKAAGVDACLDDRNARAGVKFADAELVGIPWRVVIGPRGIKNGVVELVNRKTLEAVEVPLEAIVADLKAKIDAERVPAGGELPL